MTLPVPPVMGPLVVTAANGQLGRALRASAPQAVFLDRDALDLTRPEGALCTLVGLRPAVIIHASAYTAVDAAESDPEGAHAVNVAGTAAVAQAAGEADALLVYVSTDYVFAGDRTEPYAEDHPVAPASVYGTTKLAGERLAAAVPRHLIVRTSWVFGEGHNFIAAILRAAPGREELTVVDDQRGRPTYTPDLADGILALVELGATGTYHLQGGGEPATWADVAEAALASAGLATTVRRIPTAEYNAGRPGPIAARPAYSVLDCSKAAALGVALRPWRDTVAEYVKVRA